MRLNTVRIPFKTGDQFTVYPIGDIHFGSANCDVKLLDEVIAEVRADPNARWIGMGDICEFIGPNDKRWDSGDIDKRVVSLDCEGHIGDTYVRKIAAKLKCIAGKCLAYGDGNHEQAWLKYNTSDMSWRILELMGLGGDDPEKRPLIHTQWDCLTRIVFDHSTRDRSLAVRIFHGHGWQAGRQEGGKVNEVRRLMAYIEADIYLQGHSHSKWVVPQTRLETNGRFTKLVAHEVYTSHTGSFLRTLQQNHVGYSERAGYPPTSTGVVKFILKPEEDKVRIAAVQGG